MAGSGVGGQPAEGEDPQRGSATPDTDRGRALAEIAGLVLALGGLSFFLGRSYLVKAYSDPVQWYTFGLNFTAEFGERHLAYLFPLLIAGVTQIVGPFRAFLVNIPLLLVLALLLHAFGRQLLGGGRSPAFERWAPQAGAATLLLFVLVASTADRVTALPMLRLFSSPYRDVLAHVLLVASLIALVAHRRSPVHALRPVGVSAACLALATSTREASVLALIPMALYAVGCRLSSRDLPFLRPALVFSLTFTVFLVPYLIQNYLYSENPLIPGQAANPTAGGLKYATLVPGVSLANLSETFPRTLAYLHRHYGTGVVGLMALGVAVALRYRLEAALYLALTGLIVFLGFYGAYYTMVARYLFVVDLFALPLAGVGVAGALHLLTSVTGPRTRERLATTSLLAIFALAGGVGLRNAVPAGAPFRIADAMALHADVTKVLPPRARVLGDRPLAEIFRSFVSDRAVALEFLVASRSLGDPELIVRVDEIVESGDPVYLVTAREATQQVLREGFDLALVYRFPAADYGLQDLLKAESFSLYRVTPWARNEIATELHPHRVGRHVLSVDVGRLSRTGGQATLYWNDRRLDPPPRDGWSCYDVRVTSESDPASVRLVSDRPVPGELVARLHDPLRTRFPRGYPRPERTVSPCLDGESSLRAAGPQRVAVPAFLAEGAAFIVRASLEIETRTPGLRGELELHVEGESVYHGEYRRRPKTAEPVFVSFPFVLTEDQVSEGRALVDISARGPGGEPDDVRVISLAVYRHLLADELELEVGEESDEPLLRSGFYARPTKYSGPLPYRWTRGRASLWLLVSPSDQRRELEIRSFTGSRPAGVPPPAPDFRLNGQPLVEIEERREPMAVPSQDLPAGSAAVPDAYTEVTRVFDLPRGLLRDPVNVLEIEATPWIPSESLPGSNNRSRLGLMLNRVQVMRSLPAARSE
jgi:hypothetical protein